MDSVWRIVANYFSILSRQSLLSISMTRSWRSRWRVKERGIMLGFWSSGWRILCMEMLSMSGELLYRRTRRCQNWNNDLGIYFSEVWNRLVNAPHSGWFSRIRYNTIFHSRWLMFLRSPQVSGAESGYLASRSQLQKGVILTNFKYLHHQRK